MRTSILSTAILLVSASLAWAQTDSAPTGSVADAFTKAQVLAGNFGGAGALGVAPGNLSKGRFDSLIRFDTTGAKTLFDQAYGVGNWTVQSMSLRLTSTAPNNPAFNGQGAGPGGTNVNFEGNFNVYRITDNTWIEGTGTPPNGNATGVTFATEPSNAADELIGDQRHFPGGTSGNNFYDLTSSAGVQSAVSAA